MSFVRYRLTWHFVFFALICVFLVMPGANAQSLFGVPTASSSSDAKQTISLDQLADLLENDKTRQQLVDELRQAAAAEKSDGGEASKKAPAEEAAADTGAKSVDEQPEKTNGGTETAARAEPGSEKKRTPFMRRLARQTAAQAEKAGAVVVAAWDHLSDLNKTKDEGKAAAVVNWDALTHGVILFAAVVIATVVAFLVLRLLAGGLFTRIAHWPEHSASHRGLVWRRTLSVLLGVAIDIAIVFIAGSIGYAVGLFGVGDGVEMTSAQTLFINAFIVIELLKVVVRALFAEKYTNLRPLRISDETSAWWSIRLRWFIGVIGYAMLVLVPIISRSFSDLVTSIVSFLVMGGAYIYALNVIFGNRKLLSQRLRDLAKASTLTFFAILYRMLSHVWWIVAVVYFTALFVTSQLYRELALPWILWSTVQTIVVAAICLIISGLLSRLIGYRFHFSPHLSARLPSLEKRLNSYVPDALKVLRIIVLILFAAITLSIWSIFDFEGWLDTEFGSRVVNAVLHVALVWLIAAVAWVVLASIIENRMNPGTSGGAPSARVQTLLTLFRNTVAILIVGFTVMITLSQIGVNIGPLLAGAGVFGLAIGFGAQKMVQDIITGVFIQLENAMNTGDVVNLAGIFGTVERLTIRSVSLRDIDGGYHVIPFSSVATVSNYMREYAYHRFEYRVAYREDIDNVIVHLREAFEELKADPNIAPNILEDMTIPGVTALDENSVKIRIMIKTVAGMQWAVGRAYNRLVKIHFDRAGIEIPYPHQTLYFGEDREGRAPSAKIRVVNATEDAKHQIPEQPRERVRDDDEAPDETGDAP